MIAKTYRSEWQQHAPWPDSGVVEQYLVICRALVNIFNQPAVRDNLAFRGGSAAVQLVPSVC